jgi:hypothetical protein
MILASRLAINVYFYLIVKHCLRCSRKWHLCIDTVEIDWTIEPTLNSEVGNAGNR